MKRILYLAFAMVVALFTSCDKEEAVTLVGSWEATDVSYVLYLGDVPIQEGSENVSDTVGDMGLTFHKDNTLEAYSTDEAGEVTRETGTYKLEGSKLSINLTDEILDFTVVELTAQKLVLGMTQVESMEGMTIKVEIKLNMKRK